MSDNPPGGWSVSEGVWGTDMDRETSIVREGANAIKYISTATATVRLQSDYHPVAEGQPYRVAALMRADNVTESVRFLVNWYTAAKAFISGNTLINAALPVIDTWYEIAGVYDAPANAAFARIKIGRSTASFNAYSAYARIRPHPVCFSAVLNSGTTSLGAGNLLTYDKDDGTGTTYDHGSNYSSSTGLFTAPAGGPYSFSATARVENLNAGHYAYLGWLVNGSVVRWGQTVYAHANGDDPVAAIDDPLLLSRGDTVGVAVYHGYGSSRNITGATGAVYPSTFSGVAL